MLPSDDDARTQEIKRSALLGVAPAPPNRWAAFTDDELSEMHGWLDQLMDMNFRGMDYNLGNEITAELERRRA